MANYQIPMTGAQITDALTQLVNRVAEGWAVGSRDGNPVSSGSPYYHNNAKYYSENAAASAARAESAIPASTAGAVFFDRSQSLTDAQKAQARNNIGVGGGGSNGNLLDNWWWGTGVVNQRGVTSGTEFTSNIFRMDRWNTTWGSSHTGGTWALSENGLTINANTSAEFFRQTIVNGAALIGKQLCASFMLSDGTIYSSTITRQSTTQTFQNIGLTGVTMAIDSSNRFEIGASNGYSFTFKAVKLELGAASTLANDAPPNFAAELAKCQLYFQRIYSVKNHPFAFGMAWDATHIRGLIPLASPLRINGGSITVSLNGTLGYAGNGSVGDIASIDSVLNYLPYNGSCCLVFTTASNVSQYQNYVIRGVSSGAYIDISADL